MGNPAVSRSRLWLIFAGFLLAACQNMEVVRTISLPVTTQVETPVSFLSATETIQAAVINVTSTPVRTASLESIQASTTPTSTPTQTPVVDPTAQQLPDVLVALRPQNIDRLAQLGFLRFDPWELITAISWAPKDEAVAIAAGNFIRVFRPWTWEQITELEIGAFTYSLDFDPFGNWLAAGSRDGVLRVWSTPNLLGPINTNPAPNLVLQAHKKGVNSIAFSPDGRILASGGSDAVARFWDPVSGELLGSAIGGTFVVPGIAFAPQGGSVAVINGDVVRLRDIDSESILGTFLADASLYCLAYNPAGDWLSVGGVDNRIRLWRPSQAFRSGQEEYPDAVFLEGHAGAPGSYQALIWQVRFSPDGDLLASAGGDATLRFWNPDQAALLTTLRAHTLAVTSLAFQRQGLALATGGLDGVVYFWGITE